MFHAWKSKSWYGRDYMVVGFITTCTVPIWNQCLSPLMMWVQTLFSRGILDTTLCGKVCQWLATGCLFFSGYSSSFTNKPDCHDIIEILLKVVLTTINLKPIWVACIVVMWKKKYFNMGMLSSICRSNNFHFYDDFLSYFLVYWSSWNFLQKDSWL